jgi:hypothetical protein
MFQFLLAAVVAAPLADEPQFVATSPADERPAGKLVRLTPEFIATVSTKGGEVTVKDVFGLRRSDVPLPALPTGPHLLTTSGDRIAGTLLGGDGQSLRFRPSGLLMKPGEAWKVPLSSAAVVWLAATPADTPPDQSRYDWLGDSHNRDVLRFRNGDVARGTLEGLDPDANHPVFQFRPEPGAVRSLRGDELAAVVFNPTLARPRKLKGPSVRVVLADGSRLGLVNPAVGSNILTGDTLFGQKAVLPLASVVSLEVMQGKAVYLSDLKPKKVEQGGFLGAAWPWGADRTVRGTPLRLTTAGGESTFDKGLGTHPRTVLTYDLGGKYRRFEAEVGIDPEGGGRGRASVRVLVDGKERELPAPANLVAGTAAPVRVDVRGAKELTLVVDYGPAGGVLAEVNWGDARLIE